MEALGGGLSVSGVHLERYLSDLRPSQGHYSLAHLVGAGILGPIILTTNFDNLIETAIEDVIGEVRIIVYEERGVPIPATPGIPTVVKLHGDMADPGTLRLRPEAVREYAEPTASSLKALIHDQGLLIVGHSLFDADLTKVLDDAAPTRFFLGYIQPAELNSSAQRILASHGSSANVAQLTFDELMVRLNHRSASRTSYLTAASMFDDMWTSLDRLRFCGSHSRPAPSDAGVAAIIAPSEGSNFDSLAEYQAVSLLFKYELRERVGPELVHRALELLSQAFEMRTDYDTQTRLRISGRYVSEVVSAILAGRELPVGLRHSEDPLTAVVNSGTEELAIPGAAQYAVDAAFLEVALAEAHKELYTRLSNSVVSIR
jgi:hypothetical protein